MKENVICSKCGMPFKDNCRIPIIYCPRCRGSIKCEDNTVSINDWEEWKILCEKGIQIGMSIDGKKLHIFRKDTGKNYYMSYCRAHINPSSIQLRSGLGNDICQICMSNLYNGRYDEDWEYPFRRNR